MNSWYPFKKGTRVERGEKYAYSIPSGKVLESKGVQCIEERPLLVRHKSKEVI